MSLHFHIKNTVDSASDTAWLIEAGGCLPGPVKARPLAVVWASVASSPDTAVTDVPESTSVNVTS